MHNTPAANELVNGSTQQQTWEIPRIPLTVLTDSYKTSHFLQYPRGVSKMVAYGEFRSGYNRDKDDTRLIFFGLQYIIDTHLSRPWTMADVHKAELFFSTHLAGYRAFPFPRDLFIRIVEQHQGYFPVTIQALAEGTAVHSHVPVYQIISKHEFAPLVTYLETLLTHVWYPCTVATLSRRARDIIENAFERSADGGASHPLVPSRLHDFGFRGCTCLEQSVIGGTAHLLNFDGSDTLSACYYAQYTLNNGTPVGTSIPATEHSVMTAWPSERAAIENMIDEFGDGIFACVLDSYDYHQAIYHVVPSLKDKLLQRGGLLVMRPDSGDPVECVVEALKAAEGAFGVSVNSKGYKVVNSSGVIQGDGIDVYMLAKVLDAVLQAGYSAQNVAFGMGAGLLQKVNRDTMSFATKLSHMVFSDGTARDVMKNPKTDQAKRSLPGSVAVRRVNGVPTVFPAEEVSDTDNLLQPVWDCGPIQERTVPAFSDIRRKVDAEWRALPRTAPVYSESMQQKLQEVSMGVYRTLSNPLDV